MTTTIADCFSKVIGHGELRLQVYPPVEDKGFEKSARLHILQSDAWTLLEDVLIEGCPPLTSDQTEYGGRIIRTQVENGRLNVLGRIETPLNGAEGGKRACPFLVKGGPATHDHPYSNRYFIGYYQ